MIPACECTVNQSLDFVLPASWAQSSQKNTTWTNLHCLMKSPGNFNTINTRDWPVYNINPPYGLSLFVLRCLSVRQATHSSVGLPVCLPSVLFALYWLCICTLVVRKRQFVLCCETKLELTKSLRQTPTPFWSSSTALGHRYTPRVFVVCVLGAWMHTWDFVHQNSSLAYRNK